MNYKSSSAYDFDLFLPKEKQTPKKNNIVKMPQRNRTAAKAEHPLKGRMGAVFMSMLMVALLCVMIYTRVETSETQDHIKSYEKTLEQLKSEHTRMTMEMESKISFKSVEEAAEALGMVKKNKDSVQYVTVADEDKVEINGSN